jgi:hypothetical protein
MSNVLLDTFRLAGGQYYELKDVIQNIHINDLLDLVAEPENTYDEFAVQVVWEDDDHRFMLGYLSRTNNRIIHNMLINDLKLYGLVTQVDQQFSTRLEFDIYLHL